jgi:hypothetical protein
MINLKKEIEPKYIPAVLITLAVIFGGIVWIVSSVNKDSSNTNVLLPETTIPPPAQVLPVSSIASSSLSDTTVKENITSPTPKKATTSTSFELSTVPDTVSQKQAVELIKGCYVKSIVKPGVKKLILINDREVKVYTGSVNDKESIDQAIKTANNICVSRIGTTIEDSFWP